MTDTDKISVIIPCLNEEVNLKELIPYLIKYGDGVISEIIVVDGGSQDNSIAVAKSFGAFVVQSPICNRAAQLNLGAQHARGCIFYFLHADTRPVKDFAKVILANVAKGKNVGCFCYRFESDCTLLKFNSWFTRFNGVFSGGGDQSLFIKRSSFEALGGYDESFCIMEDFELVSRIRQTYDFHVLQDEMTVSARKYKGNSWVKVQLANLTAFSLFLLKVKPASIKSLYLNFLNQKNKKHNSS
ncbi:TIGR04283 family arsenosugar biosynthesis glycosyltransferase [Algoriphagus sp. D3-2-R+10]|uniref:TIGR04283 family arsenosugar biosynthesis glycosyltransferase n=1 Tax=Algoriphagus aurantiacus TaxID=3103948 RepID=UPI002B3B4077|nr:TIGR04283 family arsenosugar biosynthesis glycosyltransferase [Algoriphagus sp. D3-2-R+10]MEB2775292.1 TIGR04283 family arsenosugar biosynthesis glycosyltransferase [Algoriphagus sp. D3-2-R+10]